MLPARYVDGRFNECQIFISSYKGQIGYFPTRLDVSILHTVFGLNIQHRKNTYNYSNIHRIFIQ